jgi:hypothetical protein
LQEFNHGPHGRRGRGSPPRRKAGAEDAKLPDFKPLVEFTTGEKKVCNFSRRLSRPAFSRLKYAEGNQTNQGFADKIPVEGTR